MPSNLRARLRFEDLNGNAYLFVDHVRMDSYEGLEHRLGLAAVVLRVALDLLHQLPVAVVGHVVLENVADEALLNRRAPAVAADRIDPAIVLRPEELKRLLLGRGREREAA